MPGYPAVVEDTVLYTLRNIYGDKDITITMLDGSGLNIWGLFFVNGNPIQNIGALPIATQAEAIAGTDNTKVMTPLRTKESITANTPGGGVTDGDKGEITVTVGVWTIDADVVTNAKLANSPANTIKGNNTGSTADPIDMSVVQVKTLLAYTKSDVGLGNVDNTSDVNKPVSTAQATADGLRVLKSGDTMSGILTLFVDPTNPMEAATKQYADTKVPQSRNIATSYPLSGGGDLSANRSLVVNNFNSGLAGTVPASGGGTANFLRADGTWAAPPAGGGLTDGDKGEITVTGGVWTIDADVVTNADLANMAANSIKGNNTGSVADPIDMTVAQTKTLLALTKSDVGLGNVDNTSDVNAPVSTAQAAADALNRKIAQTLNAQSGTTYTLVLTDADKIVTLSNAAAVSLTIPTNASVAFPVGTNIDLVQLGAGQVTVGGTPTLRFTPTAKFRAQYSGATLIKLATDEWILVGDLASS